MCSCGASFPSLAPAVYRDLNDEKTNISMIFMKMQPLELIQPSIHP